MTRAIVRAAGVSVLVAVLCHSAAFTDFAAFCERHLAWRRVTSGQSTVILYTGFGVARPGDAIFACEASHCFDGLVACHEDLDCVCAPATWTADQVAAAVTGRAARCVADKPAPSPFDEQGACVHARCGDHVPR